MWDLLRFLDITEIPFPPELKTKSRKSFLEKLSCSKWILTGDDDYSSGFFLKNRTGFTTEMRGFKLSVTDKTKGRVFIFHTSVKVWVSAVRKFVIYPSGSDIVNRPNNVLLCKCVLLAWTPRCAAARPPFLSVISEKLADAAAVLSGKGRENPQTGLRTQTEHYVTDEVSCAKRKR